MQASTFLCLLDVSMPLTYSPLRRCVKFLFLDDIPQIVYNKCVHPSYNLLTMVFNVSLMFNEIPNIWKTLIVKVREV